MRRLIVLGGLLVFGALSMTAMALQQAPAPAASAIEVDKLTDNLYILKALTAGGGGNTAVFVTADGVVVVDTKNPGWGRPLLDRIKMLTDKPVTMIINTHTHGDHVSGNVEFPATVDVVAHENTKANMERCGRRRLSRSRPAARQRISSPGTMAPGWPSERSRTR